MIKALFVVLCFVAFPAIAHAAQDAMVTVEQAAIREYPTLEAKIIESKPAGAKIRISSYGKDGWYKTKSDIGQYGWIWQGDITLLAHESDIRSSDLQLTERERARRGAKYFPWLFFRAGLGLSPLIGQIESKTANFHTVFNGFGEVSVRIADQRRAAVRLLGMTSLGRLPINSVDIGDSAPGLTAAMFGLEQDLSVGESNDWSVGLYAGINLSTNIGIKYLDGSAFTLSETGYAALANVTWKHYLKNWFTLVIETGFFWDYVPQSQIPRFASSHVNIYGVMVNMGVQFGL